MKKIGIRQVNGRITFQEFEEDPPDPNVGTPIMDNNERSNMALIEIEKNDVVLTKEGKSFRVLSVYKNGTDLWKIEGIDDNEPTPMRRPVFAREISRVLKKAQKPVVVTGKKVGFGRPAAQPVSKEKVGA